MADSSIVHKGAAFAGTSGGVNYSTEQSQGNLTRSLGLTHEFQLTSNRSLSKPIRGVPIPDNLKSIFGIQDPKPEFVPVDPADRVLAQVAMQGQQSSSKRQLSGRGGNTLKSQLQN